jgi:hypothetical protein
LSFGNPEIARQRQSPLCVGFRANSSVDVEFHPGGSREKLTLVRNCHSSTGTRLDDGAYNSSDPVLNSYLSTDLLKDCVDMSRVPLLDIHFASPPFHLCMTVV